jgi:hypothetical protein
MTSKRRKMMESELRLKIAGVVIRQSYIPERDLVLYEWQNRDPVFFNMERERDEAIIELTRVRLELFNVQSDLRNAENTIARLCDATMSKLVGRTR